MCVRGAGTCFAPGREGQRGPAKRVVKAWDARGKIAHKALALIFLLQGFVIINAYCEVLSIPYIAFLV